MMKCVSVSVAWVRKDKKIVVIAGDLNLLMLMVGNTNKKYNNSSSNSSSCCDEKDNYNEQ